MLLSQEVFTPDDRKSTSSLSVHKKGLCKSVTFKETPETNQLPPSSKRCHESGGKSSFKEKSGRSPPLRSYILDTEPETLQGHIENTSNNFVAADKNWVTSSSDSVPLSDNEKILGDDVGKEENKACSRTQDDQDWTLNNAEIVACSGPGKHVPIISTCNEEHSDPAKEDSFVSDKKELAVKEMEIPHIDIVVKVEHSSDHNSEKAFTKDGQDVSTAKVKDILESEECSSVNKSDNSPSEKWHWLQLFEEEFPRRSPRLRSTPNFGSQTVLSQDSSYALHTQKTKPSRSKQSTRARKESTSHTGEKIIKCNTVESNLCDNLAEEGMTKDFVFPRPSSEQIKTGGPLNVTVDFSLPDKEFAKLKLAKIKGALPVERINRAAANDQSKKTTTRHDDVMNSNDNILLESKREEEMKENCCYPLTKSASSVLACSAQMDTNSAKSTDENRTNIAQVLSTSLNLECNNQSECAVNNSPLSFKHQQFDVQFQKEPINSCNNSFSPKKQSQEDMTTQKAFVCETDVESSAPKNSCVRTVTTAAEVHDVHQTVVEQHVLCDEHDKLGNKSSANIDERLLDNNVLLQCGSGQPQKVNKFPNERDSFHQCPETVTDDMDKTSISTLAFEANNLVIQKSPEQQYNRKEFNLTEEKSSPPNPEPSIGDQATPHGKMKEPLEKSQLSCMMSPQDRSELSPVLMMACFQVSYYFLYKYTCRL